MTPTMKEICEGLDVHHNVDDSILAKRASPNTASNAFRSLPTATEVGLKLPCFYYSNITDEGGVEGVFRNGFETLSIFFQMKLYSTATPMNISRIGW